MSETPLRERFIVIKRLCFAIGEKEMNDCCPYGFTLFTFERVEIDGMSGCQSRNCLFSFPHLNGGST